jgi:hypothetical protein
VPLPNDESANRYDGLLVQNHGSGQWNCRSAAPAWEFPRSVASACSSAFIASRGIRARTYEGTGIGLALVQELVKLHSGSVRVESALGLGSTFTVTIPTVRAHLPAERI